MKFKPITAEDKELIQAFLKKGDSRSCDMCFATLYLWRNFYRLEYTVYEDNLIFKSGDDWMSMSFCFPIGDGDKRKAVLALMEYSGQHDHKLILNNFYREHEEWFLKTFPDQFDITYDRNIADYIYECDKLIRLSGKKYHKKKNHVNKFLKTFPDWSYENITEDNLTECFQMLEEFKERNGDPSGPEKAEELRVTEYYLNNLEFLEQKGGLIRAGGKVVAFAIGEKINSDTLVVHIEKALADVPGAYAIINQQFLVHEAEGCTYVNREDDVGEPGLRKAKLSYRPAFLLEKGYAVER